MKDRINTLVYFFFVYLLFPVVVLLLAVFVISLFSTITYSEVMRLIATKAIFITCWIVYMVVSAIVDFGEY